MNIFFKRKEKPALNQGMRQYEWRTQDGKITSGPTYARNACEFRLMSARKGAVKEGGGGGNTVYLYVTATGERVKTELNNDFDKCRLSNVEDAQWYKV